MRHDSGCIFGLFAAISILSCCTVLAQPSSTPELNFPVADSTVLTAVETNGILYVGGYFTQIGPSTGAFAAVSPTSGVPARPFPYFSGTVSCSIPDGKGGVYVGGSFVTIGTVVTTNLAHLGADLTLDPSFAFAIDAGVTALAVYNDQLLVGGSFNAINGQSRSNLAQVNLVSKQAEAFGLPIDGPVQALVVSGDRLYLGGVFTHINDVTRNYLACVDLARGELTAWDPAPDSNFNLGVNTLVATDGRIYVAGDFNRLASTARAQVAAFDATTGQLLDWDAHVYVPYTAQTVQALAVSSNAVYIGGNFASLGGQSRSHLGAVDTITGSVLPWQPGIPYNAVRALAVSGNTVYVGGDFPGIGIDGPQYLAAVNGSSGAVLPWTPAPGGTVLSILPLNNQVFVGGAFGSIGGINRQVVAAIDLSTETPTSWDAHMMANGATGSFVSSLVLSGESLILSGWFYGIGGELRDSYGAVRLDDASVLPIDGSVLPQPGYPPRLSGLLFAGNNLIIAATYANPVPVVFDAVTGLQVDWDFGVDGGISSFAATSNTLYIGGSFAIAGGQPRANLAAFDIATRQLLPWHPIVNGSVATILARDQTIIAYGNFLTANGQSRTNLAVFDAVSGDLALGPTGLVLDGEIRDINATQNALYLAGNFNHVNQETRSCFAAVDLLTGQVRPWNPGVPTVSVNYEARGWKTLIAADKLIIAGSFSAIGGNPRTGLAAFALTNLPPKVQILIPTNNTVLHAPAQIPLEIQASSPSNAIARVEVYCRTNLIASTTNGSFATNWVVPRHVGDYLVTAVGYDRYGESAFSPAARITVNLPTDYIPPTVSITFPQSNAVYAPFSTIPVQTEVNAPKSSVEKLQVLLGTNVLATFTNAPYTFSLTNMSPGTYSVTALVEDEFGITATNGPVAFRINSPPHVFLVNALYGIVMGSHTNLQLTAPATDADGFISNVTIYNDGDVIASFTNAPFTFNWTNPPAGYYAFTAVATDDFGSKATSSVMKVTVYPGPKYLQVLDNKDTNVTFAGSWNTGPDGYLGSYRFAYGSTEAATATATCRPHIPASGPYDVYIYYMRRIIASTSSQWQISYNGGVTNIIVDQAYRGGAGKWSLLASGINFMEGTNGFIALSNLGDTNQIVIIDAVRVVSSTVPFVVSQPLSQSVKIGKSATLSVSATGSPPLSYQWKFNGTDITNATSTNLVVANVQPDKAGAYSVVVSNFLSSAISTSAILTLAAPSAPRLSAIWTPSEGVIQLLLNSDPGVAFTIETSTNMVEWTTFMQIPSGTGTNAFSDTVTSDVRRFYRARW